IGRKVGGIDRVAHSPQHLAAAGRDERRGVALEGMPECVVGGDEKPAIPTLLHQCPAGRCRKAVGVEAPVHAVRRTGFSGKIRGGSAGVDVNGVVRARHLAHGEPHGRIGNVEDEVDASVSIHCRAMLAPTSGLFWWSAKMTSIGRPSTLPPKSSTAMRAAWTEPMPERSAYSPVWSLRTPSLTGCCATAEAVSPTPHTNASA